MFIPRHPVVENQFCSYAENQLFGSPGVGGVVAYAGSVVFLDSGATNEEPMVKAYSTDAFMQTLTANTDPENYPFGFLEQKVKVGYHQVHPTGFSMPGDLGSSDVIAQPYYNNAGAIVGHKSAPAAVAHNGIWDTIHYICRHTDDVVADGDHMMPGQRLWVACNNMGRVTNHSAGATDDTKDYEALQTKAARSVLPAVARVVKGAGFLRCSANIANTTLYAIRIKLLV